MNTALLQEEIELTQRTYYDHRLLAQFAFCDDSIATGLLQLCEVPVLKDDWLIQATEFYQVVLPLSEFMEKCGVYKDELRQARAMVEALIVALAK